MERWEALNTVEKRAKQSSGCGLVLGCNLRFLPQPEPQKGPEAIRFGARFRAVAAVIQPAYQEPLLSLLLSNPPPPVSPDDVSS